MATYVGGDSGNTSGTTFDLTWPTVAANDQALLWWTGFSDVSFTDPTGFTLVESFVGNSGSQTSRLYRKTCTGSEDGTAVTLTMGSANKHSAVLVVYRGVSTSAPINGYDCIDTVASASSHACPQVTPSVAGCVPVVAISERFSSGTSNYVPPAGYTERGDTGSLGGGGATIVAVADDGLATSHAAGVAINPGSFSGGVANDNVVTWTVLLAPASQSVAVGQAAETDVAQAVAWSPKHRTVGTADEVDTAFGFPQVIEVGQASETAEAFVIRPDARPVLTWSVLIDWDGDGFTDSDEVTSRVLERTGLSMEYGRDQARAMSPTAAGRAGLELDNRSRDYSPDNQASPLYGKLIQARPLRIRATLDPDAMNSNPLFGSDVSGWTANSGTIEHSTDVVHPDGTGSMKFTPTGGLPAGGAGSNLVDITPGQSYTASMWACSPTGWGDGIDSGVRVMINWYDASEVFLFTDPGTDTILSAGEWKEMGDTFVAPDGAGKAAVWAWQTGSPSSGDVWYAWNVRLAPISSVNTLFEGYTDEYTVEPAPDKRSVALSGLDPIAKLRGAKATTALYRSVRTGTAIGYVLDAIGWPVDKRDLDPGATIAAWWWAEDQDAFEAIEQLVQSEGPPAMLHADEFGRIVFRDRHHRLLNDASRFAQATFVDSSEDGEPAFSQFTYDHGWREVVNSVSIKVDELDPSPAAEQVWSSESIVNIASSSSLVLRITLDDPVYEATGNFEVIGGSATQSLTANSGQTLTWTITAGAGGATLANLEILGQPVAVRRSYTVLKEDQSSINSYGLRSQTYEVPWAGVNDADAIGQLILEASAQRRPIVTITLVSGTWVESERLRQQLSRDLSDRVHVREPETQVDHDFYVERIGHTIGSAGLTVETTIGMERAILQADNVFRFDDSDHGFDDGVFASVSLTDPSVLFRFDVAGQGFDDGVFAT